MQSRLASTFKTNKISPIGLNDDNHNNGNLFEMIRATCLDMGDEITSIGETFATITFELLLSGVHRLVPLNGRLLRK